MNKIIVFLKQHQLRIIFLLCISLIVYKICSIFFPGYLDFTYWQFRQATGQSGEQINNWHPPMVSYMLRTSQQTFGDIGWFFVFNVLILWMGIVLILDYLIVNKVWCIVLSLL